MTILVAALLVLALPVVLATAYLLVLTVLSAEAPALPSPPPRVRFDILVPAHDEEVGIARTVASLLALEWPRESFRVLVVADNCSDGTASLAADAGAVVLVRNDPEHRGKGYALEAGYARILADGQADATVVVDADTFVSRNLLERFASHIERGERALQARYGVLNVEASWRTRLMAIAFAMFHDVRSLGRCRLGASCGLRGNGMCFTRDVLARVPHQAFSIVEDLEYGIRLGEAGVRVCYVHEASVRGEMAAAGHGVANPAPALGGRAQADPASSTRRSLLREGIRRPDRVLLDLAVDVILPPLSSIAGYALAGLVAATAAWHFGAPAWTVAPWAASLLFLAMHVLRGVQLSGHGCARPRGARLRSRVRRVEVDLLPSGVAPGHGEWIRTSRTRD